MNAQSHDNIGCEAGETSSAGVSHSSQITIPSNDAESDSNSETDVAVSSFEETNMVVLYSFLWLIL